MDRYSIQESIVSEDTDISPQSGTYQLNFVNIKLYIVTRKHNSYFRSEATIYIYSKCLSIGMLRNKRLGETLIFCLLLR